MKRTMGWMMGGMMGWAIMAVQAVPPPPPGNGGGIKPPDAPPPGKLYFKDNVVIVGPGFVKPDSNGGTLFVDISTINNGTVTPGKTDPAKTIERVVREVGQVKTQVEAGAVAMPPGLLNPAAMLLLLMDDREEGLFKGTALLSEESGSREPASADRSGDAKTGGASVKAASDAPAPRQPARSGAGAAVIPSYWQLPIR